MDLAVLVPVKDLRQAKTRLAPLLTAAERLALAQCLLEGVLGVVAGLPASVRKVLVTAYPPAGALAQRLGLEVLWEQEAVSESQSVDQASALLEQRGAAGVLRVPLDLPLLELPDLERLLALARAGEQALLVPSLDGTGTNALYRSPPTLFPSRFGPGSLALHRGEAAQRGVTARVEALASLALDIDEPVDVERLLAEGRPCPALHYLRGIGVPARLAAPRRAGLHPGPR